MQGHAPFFGHPVTEPIAPNRDKGVRKTHEFKSPLTLPKSPLTVGTNRVLSELCWAEHIVYLLLGHTSQTNVTD